VTPAKLVVGFPAFGHTFTLQSETENGIGADSIGVGDAGPWTQAAGTLSYNEVQVCCCVAAVGAAGENIIFFCAPPTRLLIRTKPTLSLSFSPADCGGSGRVDRGEGYAEQGAVRIQGQSVGLIRRRNFRRLQGDAI
jgi:hypothetical protein